MLCLEPLEEMSGAKRKTKYRKHIENEILEGLPEPSEGEHIVQVIGSRGGNLIEVKRHDSEEVSLCMLPSKFRKLVWVKRGSYVIASYSDENYETATGAKGKVQYTVTHILFKDQIKHLQKEGLWPPGFDTSTSEEQEDQQDDEDEEEEGDQEEAQQAAEESDSDDDIPVNLNRQAAAAFEESSDDDSSEDEE